MASVEKKSKKEKIGERENEEKSSDLKWDRKEI